MFADLLGRLTEICQEVYGSRLVSLAAFGSVARDRPRPDSDIDLLLILDSVTLGPSGRLAEFDAVEALMEPSLALARRQGVQTRLSPILRSVAEAGTTGLPFVDMALEARILVDRDGFLADAIERLRHELRDNGAERTEARGLAHWRLRSPSGKGGSAR